MCSPLIIYTLLPLLKGMVEPKTKKKKSPYQRVSNENMERIENIGKFGESFNDVLDMLLELYERMYDIKKEKTE